MHRFHEYSLGSTFELETQTLSAMRRAWCRKELAEQLLRGIDREQKMLMGFMGKLKV